MRVFLPSLCVAASAAPLLAQAPAFESPGMSPYSTLGQTTRFSTDFNPAFGFMSDVVADYAEVEGNGDDGFDLQLRIFEVSAWAYIDPDAWAYVILTSEEGEGVGIEEAAVEYVGFDSNARLKAGYFFVDFGKQMLNHVEDLRTVERPLVLRKYLGEELAGMGVQFDNWFALGEMPVRYSVALFRSLTVEAHGEEEEYEAEVETLVSSRKSLEDFSMTARLTTMRDVSDASTVQFGLSLRHVPDFAFSVDALTQEGLSNTVVGADLTYGWTDETSVKALTAGAEFLVSDGDLYGLVDDPAAPTTLDVFDDTVAGGFAFLDWRWERFRSAGVQYSWIESLEQPDADEAELEVYYSWHLTEFRRLRFAVLHNESDDHDDSTRFVVQFTNWIGPHAHSFNW